MNVVFTTYVYPHPDPGFNPGIERVVGELAEAVSAKGHDVTVLTTYRNGGTKKREYHEGVEIIRLADVRERIGRLGSIFSLDFLSLNYLINRQSRVLSEADVVHTFTPIVHKGFDAPLVSHYHHWDTPGSATEYLYLPTAHKMWMRTYAISDRVVSVSDYSANDLVERGVPAEKITTVYNGVDFENDGEATADVSSDSEFDLLYVGPLTERKGIEYLIRSMPDILAEHPGANLHIVGGGDQEEYADLAERIGVAESVEFAGFVEEERLVSYYVSADVFILPSLLEGFGMVLAEAMCFGTPVVASDTSAIPEVVDDAGLLVEPKDSTAIAENVCRILSDSELRNTLKERGVQRVKERFRWEGSATELIYMYSNLISV
ncbi:glycosyltransferase family 4 protein [Halobacteria archaeon HArc-gm2]|nr:glycosyltransferase family 4 protein [Halobacteria archaeon HArc-gm2]